MSNLQAHLNRLAIFLNGYYEVDNDGNKYRSHFVHCYNDDIFCKLFISELEFITHLDSDGVKIKPNRVSEDELKNYISLINDNYFYVVYDCFQTDPQHCNLLHSIDFPHISKLLVKTFPTLLYTQALKLIHDLNLHVYYGYFEISDYYLNNMTYLFKYAKIEDLRKILEKFEHENVS